jgi:Ca2+-binding EF-hand superfamily protein
MNTRIPLQTKAHPAPNHSFIRLPGFPVIALGLILASVGCRPAPPVAETTPDKKDLRDVTKHEMAESDSSQENVRSIVSAPENLDQAIIGESPAAETDATVQRFISLTSHGPLLIDLHLSIEGRSLEQTAQAAVDRTVRQLEVDLAKPWTWDALLDHPLVKSGWLGNLTPQDSERDQLIRMYNSNGDDEVDEDELAPFLTRGLARSPSIRFTDSGPTSFSATDSGANSDSFLNTSPWGPLDANQDHMLDKSEIDSLLTNAARIDLNDDQIITLAEAMVAGAIRGGSAGSSTRTMLASASAFAVTPDQTPGQIGGKVLDHYTFLSGIPREQWPAWSDSEWQELDSNSDQQLSRRELEKLVVLSPHLALHVDFRDLTVQSQDEAQRLLSLHVNASDQFDWVSRVPSAGQANSKALTLAVTVNDSYSDSARRAIRRQLSAALDDPALQSMVRAQLQLNDDAFQQLDADQDQNLSDEEFERAWTWLTAIRGTRAIARWSINEIFWFQLVDFDGDGRISEVELKRFASQALTMDTNRNGFISPSEAPLVAQLEISRSDDRLQGLNRELRGPASLQAGNDWFHATDINGDGFVAKSEFLGDKEDFMTYDLDGDGFISENEGFPK